jgi:hypothetical protein
MANQEEFKEGIESNRKRLVDELNYMNSNSFCFIDKRNSDAELKHAIQQFRRSLDKCTIYISSIEYLIERRENEEINVDPDKGDKRVIVADREDI